MIWLVAAMGCRGPETTDLDSGSPVTVPESWPAEWVAEEDAVLRLVNIQRTLGANCGGTFMAGGAPLLEMDELLRDVARAHSQNMAVRGFFDHVSPAGKDPFDRMGEAGFTGAEPWGENIAAGSPTADTVVDGWMHSPGHCTNIMEPQFGVIGIGLYFTTDSDYGYYWTQNFAGSH